jgi:signal transduction histidine kinase/DNA-binding response OmpR family regulator
MMPDSDKTNILIVDDLPEKLLVLETILADLGQNIITARSGEEALRKVLEYEFAVILLDVSMPGMSGFETAEYIRRRKKSARTPIIFITAYADEMHATQGYTIGAVDYILAPVVPEVLRTKVRVFVELYQMTQQARRQADERVALAQEQAARAAAEEATRRSHFLAEASTTLSSSLDLAATFRNLAGLVVPFLADVGAVTPIDERGQSGQTELAWVSTGNEVRRCAIPNRNDLHPAVADAIERAASAKEVELILEPAHWRLQPEEETKGTNGQLGPCPQEIVLETAAVLPLRARGRTLGVLLLGLGPSGRRYSPGDLALAEDLAGRAAIALDNARLYQNIQEGDRRKNEFLAMLAHELRNPLAPIRNAVHVLRLLGLKEPTLVQSRDMIDRQVTHMARLIDDLLDMSRLSRGKILLRKERLDLTALVQNTAEDYRGSLETAGLKLEVRLPGMPVVVVGDPTRLAQVVGNVLHNAHKFTDPGGLVTVDLTCEREGRTAVIRLRDTGIGMEPEMLGRVFETFSQADSSLDRSRGGLGLGLALVKGLIQLHGGEVAAASPGLGQGTEITIRLPLDEHAEAPSPEQELPNHGGGAHRILVIEDNPDTAESIRMLLTLNGHEVEVAYKGAGGLEAARTFRPEIVLCDIGLPGGMDGYAVARTLRQDPELASIYLIATTGYGQDEDQRRSREAGFDAHLTKPVDFTEFERLLASLPARSETFRQ